MMSSLIAPVDLTDVELLPPEAQGAWQAIPIRPDVKLTTPKLCVVQNNLANELPSASSWVVRNLSVGVFPDAAGSRLYDSINRLENFVKVGTATLWPLWRGEIFSRQFVSVMRTSHHPAYQAEMRLNVLFTKDSELNVEDERGKRVSPMQIALGNMVTVDLVVAGMWCSADRCGLRYTVKRIVVHDDPVTPPGARRACCLE
jgi:hypothetical protein